MIYAGLFCFRWQLMLLLLSCFISEYTTPSRHLSVCDEVNVCVSVIVQDIRCFGYRNFTLETSSPSL